LEHLPEREAAIAELTRVLAPDGTLILGTPDYSRRLWRIIERLYGLAAPGGYAEEHITHYTDQSLVALLRAHGFCPVETRYIFGADMYVAFQRVTEMATSEHDAVLPVYSPRLEYVS